MTPLQRATPLRAAALTAVASGAGLVFLLAGLMSRADDKKADDKKPDAGAAPLTEARVIKRVNAATSKALDYLESKQIKEGVNTGAWRADVQAMNALAVLAFLSSGHTPGRGKYGDVVEDNVVKAGVLTRAKKFILSRASPIGAAPPMGQPDLRPIDLAIGRGSNNDMYEHGLTTLALAELYGMDPDPDLEDVLRKAVELIVKTQKPYVEGQPLSGGWRYQPTQMDADLSVTVMQVVALRAANNAGVPVPAKTFEDAARYVQASAQRGPDGKPAGGFGYQGPGNSPQTSAGGTLCLQLLGRYDDPAVAPTLKYLSTIPVEWGGPNPPYFYYFHYYAIQAFYQAGGKEWNDWHPRVRELLLAHQNPDGSWDVPPGSAEAGYVQTDKVYSTAMATLILNIYRHYLPAYQR